MCRCDPTRGQSCPACADGIDPQPVDVDEPVDTTDPADWQYGQNLYETALFTSP